LNGGETAERLSPVGGSLSKLSFHGTWLMVIQTKHIAAAASRIWDNAPALQPYMVPASQKSDCGAAKGSDLQILCKLHNYLLYTEICVTKYDKRVCNSQGLLSPLVLTQTSTNPKAKPRAARAVLTHAKIKLG